MCSITRFPPAVPLTQVMVIDGSKVRPDAALTYPHFIVVRDRLYRVSRDTQSEEVVTQLLVPRSRREMVFQGAHYNPMAGHLGYDKTLNRIMARFYWPGIQAEVRRWCTSCPRVPVGESPGRPQGSLTAPSPAGSPFRSHRHGHYQAIRTFLTWVSICVSPDRLRNPVPGSNSVA